MTSHSVHGSPSEQFKWAKTKHTHYENGSGNNLLLSFRITSTSPTPSLVLSSLVWLINWSTWSLQLICEANQTNRTHGKWCIERLSGLFKITKLFSSSFKTRTLVPFFFDYCILCRISTTKALWGNHNNRWYLAGILLGVWFYYILL